MKITIVTSNKNKFQEISHVLAHSGIKCEMKNLQMQELGQTLEEVAASKARQAYSKFKRPVIVDDTGIFFKAYRNFPGMYAKRIYLSIGLGGLLKLLEGKTRSAYFKTTVAYCNGRQVHVFCGELHGKIEKRIHAKSPRKKFPYERIFIPNGSGVPLSMLSLDKKAKISHRAIATQKLARWLKRQIR